MLRLFSLSAYVHQLYETLNHAMSYSLYHAQALKADFNYLLGTCLPLYDQQHTSLVKGIVIVGDDGACIHEQMQYDSLQRALLDDSYLVGTPWLF